eukprot:scaffold251016_cov36-Prasinocladus_malaysianus.AAC.1
MTNQASPDVVDAMAATPNPVQNGIAPAPQIQDIDLYREGRPGVLVSHPGGIPPKNSKPAAKLAWNPGNNHARVTPNSWCCWRCACDCWLWWASVMQRVKDGFATRFPRLSALLAASSLVITVFAINSEQPASAAATPGPYAKKVADKKTAMSKTDKKFRNDEVSEVKELIGGSQGSLVQPFALDPSNPAKWMVADDAKSVEWEDHNYVTHRDELEAKLSNPVEAKALATNKLVLASANSRRCCSISISFTTVCLVLLGMIP